MAIRAVLSVCYFHLRASFIVCLQLQLRYLITLLVIICVLVFFLCVVLFVELFVLFVWFSLDVYNFTIEGIFTVFFRWISQPNLQEMWNIQLGGKQICWSVLSALSMLHCVQAENPRAACLRDLFLQEWAVSWKWGTFSIIKMLHSISRYWLQTNHLTLQM